MRFQMKPGLAATFAGTRKPNTFTLRDRKMHVYSDDDVLICRSRGTGVWTVTERDTQREVYCGKDTDTMLDRAGFLPKAKQWFIANSTA